MSVSEEEDGRGGGGYRTKNKNPTRQCGKQSQLCDVWGRNFASLESFRQVQYLSVKRFEGAFASDECYAQVDAPGISQT